MSERTPFYRRTLDSFGDEIITRQSEREGGGWHAVLDCGIDSQVSDPDFSPWGYGATREEAARNCAAAIRKDAQGMGKFAPHSVLVPGYDLHFRLMRHWDKKERLLAAGVDPNVAIEAACGREAYGIWKFKGRGLTVLRSNEMLEFDFLLHSAEMVHAVRELGAEADTAKAAAFEALKETIEPGGICWNARTSEDTWRVLDERLGEALDSVRPSAGYA